MNLYNFSMSFLYNVALAADGTPSVLDSSSLVSMMPLILLIFASYFFIIKPNKDKQKKIAQMLSEVTVGSRVETLDGLIGSIVSIDEENGIFVMNIANNVNVSIKKRAVFDLFKQDGTSRRDELLHGGSKVDVKK